MGHVRHKQRELTRASLRALFHRLKNPRRGRRAVGDDLNTSGLRDSHAAPFRLLRSEQKVRPPPPDPREHHTPPFPSRRRLLTEDRRRSYASTDAACRRRCSGTDLRPTSHATRLLPPGWSGLNPATCARLRSVRWSPLGWRAPPTDRRE